MDAPQRDRIHVLVGLIRDRHGRWLVSRRRPGTHEAGAWEFPGGKRHTGESPRTALDRELDEELGIAVTAAEPFMQLVHDYPDRSVLLDVWRVLGYAGDVRAGEGQALRWVAAAELADIGLLPADEPICRRLRLETP